MQVTPFTPPAGPPARPETNSWLTYALLLAILLLAKLPWAAPSQPATLRPTPLAGGQLSYGNGSQPRLPATTTPD